MFPVFHVLLGEGGFQGKEGNQENISPTGMYIDNNAPNKKCRSRRWLLEADWSAEL